MERVNGAPLLSLSDVSMFFGGLVAVNRVTTEVRESQIKGLIGPNGAGKTTLFNLISGIYTPTTGDITFQGDSIVGREPNRVAALGITRTFQNVRLFANMSVLENVMVGRHLHATSGFLQAALRRTSVRREESEIVATAAALLEQVGLSERAADKATDLPFGLQRTLEIARALATEPTMLLLDEPAAGLNATERRSLASLIRRIRDDGTTILLVEHDMEFVMGLVDELLVLDHGSAIAEGTPAEIQADEQVIAAYLGTPEE
ncbi:glutamine transport ATP-binding protein GlnQ [bacterium BMS3Abin02]|nr:glutamine transport ATP-binding protein GlnQ [bacterium BMS3Abin02]